MYSFQNIFSNVYIYINIYIYILYPRASQESAGPYAWRTALDPRPMETEKSPRCLACANKMGDSEGKPVHPMPHDNFQSCLADMVSEASSITAIAFRLPPPNCVAGKVVEHSMKVFDGLLVKHSPMIWKFGFSHNPSWRWCNNIYGYKFAPEKWTNMVVLYASAEPYSPAMLEATLIEKFRGT